MFQFPTSPHTTLCVHMVLPGVFPPGGFPHSEICGSMAICALPQLIAAYHVLHRLLVPRHPPYALSSLTSNFTSFILGSFHKLPSRAPCFRAFYIIRFSRYILHALSHGSLVGSNGIEPSTSRLSGVRSNHLSYEPAIFMVFICHPHIFSLCRYFALV